MKLCLCCGKPASNDDATCEDCGEASWSEDVRGKSDPKPEQKPAKGKR